MSRELLSSLAFVSRETEDRLAAFHDALLKWTSKINLISKHTKSDAWSRHILDSLQLWPLVGDDPQVWADLGSGGGLPIVPLACVAKTENPKLQFHAIESDQRKCAFLREILRKLELPLTVHPSRIEGVAPLRADIISARALAPLKDLLPHCDHHLAQGGTAVLPKGANHKAEIEQALERWRFSVQTIPSVTDSSAVILKIKDIARA